ncbi:MAG: hypothetical protein ACLP22_07610 [Solirubrobacteraceae bacterium]
MITRKTAAQIQSLLVRLLAPSGRSAQISAILNDGGYPTSFNVPVSGGVAISWYVAGKGSRAAIKMLIAGATVSETGKHDTTIKISLTSQGRHALTHAGNQLRLSGQAAFMIGGTGTPLNVSRTFTINR